MFRHHNCVRLSLRGFHVPPEGDETILLGCTIPYPPVERLDRVSMRVSEVSNIPLPAAVSGRNVAVMSDSAAVRGTYSWVANAVPGRNTERPGGSNVEELVKHVLEEVRELKERVALLESKPPSADTYRRGVTREEASTVGAKFWMIVPQARGPKLVFPVVVRTGTADPDGDGNVAYRIERLDGETKGGAVYRRPDELFRSSEDAEAAANPRRTSGESKRLTGKRSSP